MKHCVLIRVHLQNSVVALIESQNWSLITLRGEKSQQWCVSQGKNAPCQFEITSACYPLQETLPFKWGATESLRLFSRDVLGTNKSSSLYCVFSTAKTLLDTWWVIKHKSSWAESSRELIFVVHSLQITLQTRLPGHSSTQYLLMARSPEWMQQHFFFLKEDKAGTFAAVASLLF